MEAQSFGNDKEGVFQMQRFKELEARIREFPAHVPEGVSTGYGEQASEKLKAFFAKLGHERSGLLREIWGTKRHNSIGTANMLQHLELFSIPHVVGAARRVDSDRYRDDRLFTTNTGRTASAVAGAVGVNGEPTGFHMASDLYSHHLALKDNQSSAGDYARKHSSWIGKREPKVKHGIPHVVMGYSVYEMLRAGEFLAEERGVVLSDEIRAQHYDYFKEIMQHGGFHFPDRREDMEAIAVLFDELAGNTEENDEVLQTTFIRGTESLSDSDYRWLRQYNIVDDQALTFEMAQKFLRPNAQRVFEQACLDTEPSDAVY